MSGERFTDQREAANAMRRRSCDTAHIASRRMAETRGLCQQHGRNRAAGRHRGPREKRHIAALFGQACLPCAGLAQIADGGAGADAGDGGVIGDQPEC